MDRKDDVKKILSDWDLDVGLDDEEEEEVATEICRLFKPNPESCPICHGSQVVMRNGRSFHCGCWQKPDEGLLLTDYKLYFRGWNLHISDATKKQIFEDIIKAQLSKVLKAGYKSPEEVNKELGWMENAWQDYVDEMIEQAKKEERERITRFVESELWKELGFRNNQKIIDNPKWQALKSGESK